MKRKVVIFFAEARLALISVSAFVFICTSCSLSEKEQIQGSWYSFDQDSVYLELYINDTMIVLNQLPLGPVGYDYAVQDNRLVVSNSVGMERIWAIKSIKPETMILQDSLESVNYFRLNLDRDFFGSIADSVSFREFSENFNIRSAVHNRNK